MIFDLLLYFVDLRSGQDEPFRHEVRHLSHGQVVYREQVNDLEEREPWYTYGGQIQLAARAKSFCDVLRKLPYTCKQSFM